MPPLANINYWLCLLFFIVPGMIIFSIRSLFMPVYDRNGASNVFRFLMYSSWNLLLALPLIAYFRPDIFELDSFNIFENIGLVILYLFVLPILEGLVWSYINTKKINCSFVRPFFEKVLHLNIINPAPTAWDSLFYDDKERIIEVVFNDNESIFGFWGVNSYVSSENDTRDLYLEYTLKKNEDGTFDKIEDNEGLLINETKIKQMIFHKIDTERDKKFKKIYHECLRIKKENKALKEENEKLKNKIIETTETRKEN